MNLCVFDCAREVFLSRDRTGSYWKGLDSSMGTRASPHGPSLPQRTKHSIALVKARGQVHVPPPASFRFLGINSF